MEFNQVNNNAGDVVNADGSGRRELSPREFFMETTGAKLKLAGWADEAIKVRCDRWLHSCGQPKIITPSLASTLWSPLDRPRWVLSCGCFDVLHPGHIKHLQATKELGEHLVVLVTADKFARGKGDGRPLFDEQLRAESVAALECVDLVAINPYPTAAEMIAHWKPAVYAKGSEYRSKETPALQQELLALYKVNGRLEFTETDLGIHTTQIIERLGRA